MYFAGKMEGFGSSVGTREYDKEMEWKKRYRKGLGIVLRKHGLRSDFYFKDFDSLINLNLNDCF